MDKDKTIKDLFRSGPSEIFCLEWNPRPFDWDRPCFENLWKDLCGLRHWQANNLETGVIMTCERKAEERSAEMRNVVQHFNSSFIDLYDGQQRLTFMSIVFCAMRDFFLKYSHDKNLPEYGDAISAFREIQEFLAPSQRFQAPSGHHTEYITRSVSRIWTAPWAGDYLRNLLLQGTKSFSQHGLVVLEEGSERPAKQARLGEADLTSPDRKMKTAYDYVKSELEKLKRFDNVYQLFMNMKDKVKFIDARFANKKAPMSILLSAHNGKNIEPVDSFRFHLAHSGVPEGGGTATRMSQPTKAMEAEKDLQQEYFELCEKYGRETVQEAIIMVAQFELGESIRSVGDGMKAVALFERFLDSTDKKSKSRSDVFKMLSVAAIKWYHLLQFVKQPASVPLTLEGLEGLDREQALPSIEFAIGLARLQVAKERKVSILILQLILFTLMIPKLHGKSSLQKDVLDSLKALETIFLWMLLGKPKPEVRQERFEQILTDIRLYTKSDDEQWAETLKSDERRKVTNALMKLDCGANHRRPLAHAILLRLNRWCNRNGTVQLGRSFIETAHSAAKKGDESLNMETAHSAAEEGDESLKMKTVHPAAKKGDESLNLWDLVLCPKRKRSDTPDKRKERQQESEFPLTKAMMDKKKEERKACIVDELVSCWSLPKPETTSEEHFPKGVKSVAV